MKTMKPLLRSLVIPTMLFLGACGCGKEVVVAPPPPPLPPPPPPVVVVMPGLGDVFYDFDRSELRADAVEQLKTNFNWIQANTEKSVIIEGHCDERGTAEYNLALGQRRANSAKDYIVNLGVAPVRLKTVSFGEEKPFADGSNEEAWAQNRRAHFVAE
ncbi:peptidoglycan-associated lipoprotein Pal [Pelodictyon phaeoclathratiforme]|jgi:peptidoglycan-associated lipoprotein|uniref:Peptidoglycan-associated lipoprotein n=1 Tax=Pelodictyon phaeoclathratiforme (strain DSM 5477 / BU-1) TaxID=324925 RepID=B4SDA4_PELPB|nr:peptidoglycan-associated lipoprotein Pal [Pelodictyon phaeoclathratiforme]ACF44363.1 peptidoglycan-associated lipoprotein [Pelodictyon phaeoclathratiforme BU-1]MBV5289424.1 peptidoglycan-associated lipoprotein Pal [Pelodictyon phaeoclathratiforme]